ncbi:MAG: terminase large subunit [Lachnospiraceae bacterium]|nr:terminase large subunit [Lachnospiraceae bacterium]
MKWTADNSALLRYKGEIEYGKIIAGQWLWKELRNLEDDLLHNDAYIYDTEDALLRMDFMQNCIRLTKSPFYNQPMILLPWQKAFIEALYSFKLAREWYEGKHIDRFTRALLEIARKNAKSEMCSGLTNAEFVVGPEGADLVCSSNDDNQASIVYDAIDTMRSLYDPRDIDTKRNQRFILNRSTNTKIFKLSDRTRNKEGRNIDFAIVDEAHEMKTPDIVKSIEQSQSVKDNPKLIIITTEGFVQDGFLDNELARAQKIIDREDDTESGERMLPWLYRQDSETEVFTNPRSWLKSNPSLGVIKREDYLRAQVELARQSKADRIFVLTKDFNVKQNGSQTWLALEDYNYIATFDPEELRGSFCIGHVDLAETTDLTCAKAMILAPDGRKKYILTQYWIPESKLEPDKDDHADGAKYKEWAEAGYINICDGNETDLAQVAEWFYHLQVDLGIKLYKCGYDQRFAKEWLAAMDGYGWSKQYGDLEMIVQNAEVLSNAINLTEAELKSRNVIYNENPVDRWCFSNACLKLNDRRQGLIVKAANGKKIDGAVTLASLFEVYRRYKSELRKLAGIGGAETNGNP